VCHPISWFGLTKSKQLSRETKSKQTTNPIQHYKIKHTNDFIFGHFEGYTSVINVRIARDRTKQGCSILLIIRFKVKQNKKHKSIETLVISVVFNFFYL
jgi:hypothetical protein